MARPEPNICSQKWGNARAGADGSTTMTSPVCPHAATARHSNNANRIIALPGLSFISGSRPSDQMSSIESFLVFLFWPKTTLRREVTNIQLAGRRKTIWRRGRDSITAVAANYRKNLHFAYNILCLSGLQAHRTFRSRFSSFPKRRCCPPKRCQWYHSKMLVLAESADFVGIWFGAHSARCHGCCPTDRGRARLWRFPIGHNGKANPHCLPPRIVVPKDRRIARSPVNGQSYKLLLECWISANRDDSPQQEQKIGPF